MLGWFVCPTVSMVTTSKAIGLEKTLIEFAPQSSNFNSQELMLVKSQSHICYMTIKDVSLNWMCMILEP